MPSLTIRAATQNDAAAIARIYAPYVAHSTASFETEPPGSAEIARRMQAAEDTFPWLVCQKGGEVLGYAYASRLGARPGYDWACSASVYIEESARHTGMGRALYTALIKLLRLQGYRSLYALISCPNPGSEGFHQSMGFQHQGHLTHAGYKFGRPLAVAYYALDLLPICENPPRPIPLSGLDKQAVASILAGG